MCTSATPMTCLKHAFSASPPSATATVSRSKVRRASSSSTLPNYSSDKCLATAAVRVVLMGEAWQQFKVLLWKSLIFNTSININN